MFRLFQINELLSIIYLSIYHLSPYLCLLSVNHCLYLVLYYQFGLKVCEEILFILMLKLSQTYY